MAQLPGTAVPDRAHRLPQTHLDGLKPGLAVDDGPEFRLRLTPVPASDGGGDQAFDDSGRSRQRMTLLARYRAVDKTPLDLIAGDRVRVTSREAAISDDYELLGALEPIRARKTYIGWTGQVERVDLLYPQLAILQEMGGALVDSAVPVSVYPAADERAASAGVVQDWSGYAPYAWLGELAVPNRQLVVDGKTLRIVAALPHRAIPRVTLRFREGRPA